jgi:hypothetical protein
MPTFCHAPWILPTSDLSAIDLDHHVAAHHRQWHFFLDYRNIEYLKSTDHLPNHFEFIEE